LSSEAVPSSVPTQEVTPVPALLRTAVVVGLPAVLALFYAFGHLNWYLGTPLGRVPVLDERENLDFAEAIFGGALPATPFYRAPGYALVLAGLRCAGVSAGGLFPAALALGALLHGACAALAACIARRWFGALSGLIAGVLLAMDPVLVHYATQALDATLALTLFLAGLNRFAAAVAQPERPGPWAAAGILWAAATLARPNFLLVWLVVPAFAIARRGPGRARIVAAALAGLLLFGATSAWQKSVSGVGGFLPWQGPYNLWAANRPGANGRYYTQRITLPPAIARANPARAESIVLYNEETHGGPQDIAAMNAHWRRRFIDEVASHPLRWAALMARKGYALLNNWEQYNNETYAFHKALSPWLRWNPMCWGLVLVLALAGGARLASESPRAAFALAAVSGACALSILLFFVSARFRLPLAAISLVLAGGALGSPHFWKAWGPGQRASLAACAVLAALIAFSSYGGVDDRSTYVQDHVLIARAAYTVGDDATALSEATEALKMQPWHPDATAIVDAVKAEMAKKPAASR
jgi:4-amino-4-deoxy-L-arabinose transferase-like glycosyltransferase